MSGVKISVLKFNLSRDYADTVLAKQEMNCNLNSILLNKIWKYILHILFPIHIPICKDIFRPSKLILR